MASTPAPPTRRPIFVTGGAGFLGTNLALRLVDSGPVVAYGLDDRNALVHTDLEDHPGFSFVRGDVLDAAALNRALDDAAPGIVIHLAARAGVSTYFEQPVSTMKVNILGTLTLLEALAGRDVERLVYVSTSEVYGPNVFDAKEDGVTVQGNLQIPRWTYGVSKLAGEHLCFAHRLEYGLPVTSVRPFNVYGPLQVGEGAVATFVTQALAGETIRVTGLGNQIRAWCYVDDFVDGMERVIASDTTLGEVVNLGNPQGTMTIFNLAEMIVRICGSSSRIELMPHPGGPQGEIQVRVPNVDKAGRLLGFRPRVGVEEGLERTAAWFRRVLPIRV